MMNGLYAFGPSPGKSMETIKYELEALRSLAMRTRGRHMKRDSPSIQNERINFYFISR